MYPDKTDKPVIVGIGEILWDVLPSGKRAGGAPINFVYHATQLGAEGYAISAVGNDVAGAELLQELSRNGIAHCIPTVDYPTGSVLVELKRGIPTYNIIEDVAWDHIPLTDEAISVMKRADAVCFGTLAQRHEDSRNTLKALLSYAPESALRFFDINIRQAYYSEALIRELLQQANVFKLNDEELEMFRPMFHLEGDEGACCRQIMKTYGLRYLILTAGSRYSTIYAPDGCSTIPTPKVEVKDTVGAGDSFSGAFVQAILTGKGLREAHQCAVETAAFVCTQEGAWPDYRNNKHKAL